MPDIFADTSGWGHLIDPDQAYHPLAAAIYLSNRNQGRKIITTNYIITELVALLTSPLRTPRSAMIEFVSSLKASPYVEIVHVDATLDEQGWRLLAARPDKKWSLVDCVSFALMEQRGIQEALTSDHHFEQAGFVRLLKSQP